MTYLPDNRVGIRGEVRGFVVAEDQGLEARLRRSYAAARLKAQDVVEQARGVMTSASEDGVQSAEPEHNAREQRIRSVLAALHADALQATGRARAAVAQLGALLQPLDRLKDLGALLLSATKAVARMFWQLPGTAQVVVLTMVALGLVITWPQEPAVDGPTAEPPPALRMGEATLPPRFNGDLWKPVAAPIAAYHLEAPELDRSTLRYRARMHADGARQDILTWGLAQTGEGQKRRASAQGALVLEHYPKGWPEAESLFVDLVRRAALSGASVERVGEVIGLETKFGVVETAEARLGLETGQRVCLAFRHLAEAQPMQIHGFFCGTQASPVDRTALGCILDRIDLLSAGKDQALKAYFAGVERARQPCGAARLVAVRPATLDSAPALRPVAPLSHRP